MATGKYIRWQGLAITQLTVAVSVVSGLSVAGLGLGVSLLSKGLVNPGVLIFLAMGFLCTSAFCNYAAVVTRLLDFRLTARKVRKDSTPNYDKPLVIFWRDKDEYGRATWRLFWFGQTLFLLGASCLIVAVGQMYI